MNLILGIDPGTTKAYAAVNIKGNIVKVRSSKSLTASRIVSEAVKLGNVVVVATDKKKSPSFVKKIAIKLGARLIKPKQDLKVKQKLRLRKKYRISKKHSGDALSAALYAYKELRPLLRKINLFVKNNEGQNILERLEVSVIKNKVSIKKAFIKIKSGK